MDNDGRLYDGGYIGIHANVTERRDIIPGNHKQFARPANMASRPRAGHGMVLKYKRVLINRLAIFSPPFSRRPLSQMICRALLISATALAGADAFAPAALPSRFASRASSSLRLNMRSESSIWTPMSKSVIANGAQPLRMMPEPPKPDQAPQKPNIPMPMVLNWEKTFLHLFVAFKMLLGF